MAKAWGGVLAVALLAVAGTATAAPAEFKLAVVDFLSGPSASQGVLGRNAAEWVVDKWNREGGIHGVKVKLIIVDENGGPDKQVTEYRRLVLDEKVDAIVGYTSSADCLAVAPVAEEMRTLTLIHNCATRRLTEDHQLRYVFRTAVHQTADSIMGARYILAMKPDLKTIAGLNEDFAWGRDFWTDFKDAILRLKPDVKVTGEQWTKIQAVEFSAEISKLLLAKPDVVACSFWAGGLISFVKQAAPRGLFKDSLFYLSTGEQSLQDLKKEMPDGVVVGSRATPGYFLYPDPNKNPRLKEFNEGLKARFGRYPDYPAFHTYQALAGLKAAWEKAINENGGQWPRTDDVVKAFEGLTWQGPLGTVVMRRDHQAIHGAILGVTKFNAQYAFPTLQRLVTVPGDQLMPPVGVKTPDWLKTLK